MYPHAIISLVNLVVVKGKSVAAKISPIGVKVSFLAAQKQVDELAETAKALECTQTEILRISIAMAYFFLQERKKGSLCYIVGEDGQQRLFKPFEELPGDKKLGRHPDC